MQTSITCYTRSSHGGHPVLILPEGGFEVKWPQGSVTYPSARKTLIAITNREPTPSANSKDPKEPFNRYFRLGKYALNNISQDTLSLFSPSPSVVIIPSKKKGIDLAARGHEVRKLFYAGFASRVIAHGYDPEEMLQEVYKGILIRNAGKCPFDSEKSSFGHYVHMICNCLIINYGKRWGRVYHEEQYGVRDRDGEIQDAGSSDLFFTDVNPEHSSSESMAFRAVSDEAVSIAYSVGADPELTLKCLKALASGYKRSELDRIFPQTRAFQVDKAYKAAKTAANNVLRN